MHVKKFKRNSLQWKTVFSLMVIILTFLAVACTMQAENEKNCHQVITVLDGDSLRTKNSHTNKKVEMRLWGIDAPEWKQSYGEDAKNNLKRLVHKKKIHIKSVGYDKYNRLLAIVYTPENTRSINHIMVDDGFAWVYRRYCKTQECKQWVSSEAEARSAQKGLWQEKNVISPWDYKHNKF